ncbi:hypothetical protein KDH_29210 [Dictyobacter sp. S3.2.2.5]|uniref:Aminoglycoside phosphotransferase domain-containing protein n=1 Tax=Dictyobacter halimunensis TaxID=3026934 RepID=A0ABQ6FUG7_9CHLR|nr:hypothetical protein KDH_29210 [Dictyobacter sp. S3.2.2.5]
MRDAMFPATSSLVEQVLVNYDLQPPMSCELLAQRATDLYVIRAGERQFVVSISAPTTRSHEEWEAQAQIQVTLEQQNIPVTAPVQRKDGAYTQAIPVLEGVRYALLTPWIAGTPAGASLTEDQASVYGATVAQMHQCLDHHGSIYQRRQMNLEALLDEPLVWMAPLLEQFPVFSRFLADLVSRLKANVNERDLPLTPPSYGICHGDLHRNNVLFDEQGNLTIIDWEYVSYGWRAYELAALRRSLEAAVHTDGASAHHVNRVYEAYLRGYSEVRPLSQAERTALPSFMVIRHIWIQGKKIDQALRRGWGTPIFTEASVDEMMSTLQGWVKQYGILDK